LGISDWEWGGGKDLLLLNGADANSSRSTAFCKPLLLFATCETNFVMAEVMIRHGAEVVAPCVWTAVLNGDEEMVELFLRHGGNPSETGTRKPPLDQAIKNGNLKSVELLLDHSAVGYGLSRNGCLADLFASSFLNPRTKTMMWRLLRRYGVGASMAGIREIIEDRRKFGSTSTCTMDNLERIEETWSFHESILFFHENMGKEFCPTFLHFCSRKLALIFWEETLNNLWK
jgi:hypothetical protein